MITSITEHTPVDMALSVTFLLQCSQLKCSLVTLKMLAVLFVIYLINKSFFPSRLFDFSLAIVSFCNSSHYWCRRVVFYINYVFSGYVHVLRQIGMITLQITKRRKVTMRSIKCKGLKTVEDHNLMGLRKFMYVWWNLRLHWLGDCWIRQREQNR